MIGLTFGANVLSAAIIGTNVPAEPLTLARIETLPSTQQPAWNEYLKRSQEQLAADQAVLEKELRSLGRTEASNAPSAKVFGRISLQKTASWYGTAEARRIADIVVSYQTPAGGWSKRIDLTKHVRAPGEHFAPDNATKFPGATDFDAPHDVHWSYVGTFDNNATTTQLRFLGMVIAEQGAAMTDKYIASFSHGLDYIFQAQYPNGGWPQVWPLAGGYHDTITINDGAMINILDLLQDVATQTNAFAFATEAQRAHAAESVRRGIDCILAAQINAGGIRTAWCQQHDVLTLKPASARNYEMPSVCAAESAGVLEFLMSEPNPTAKLKAAVQAGVVWLKNTEIRGYAFKNSGADGRLLVSDPDSGPIWSRYYDVATNRPIFGDRNKTIHDKVAEISFERRKGYGWYSDSPKAALKEFARWKIGYLPAEKARVSKLGGERRMPKITRSNSKAAND